MSGLMMKYFVLKPQGDDRYASASRGAMIRYAILIKPTNPELSAELMEWATKESVEAYARSVEPPDSSEPGASKTERGRGSPMGPER